MVLWDKRLAEYLQSVIADFGLDHDTVRAMRRLHMKEVHMVRRNNHKGRRIVRTVRRMI